MEKRMARKVLWAFVLLSLLPGIARADYARPPDDRYPPDYDQRPREELDWERRPTSTIRLFTGPAARFSDEPARGGLVLALDAGSRGAGARFSGAWIRSGSDRGSSEYAAQVWIDFADREVLHPILGAGAALARLDRQTTVPGETGIVSENIGVGVLRATLQYRLPVKDVDARAAADIVGSVPAVGAHAADVSPWVTASVTVGIGF
jgi:hypothetical protein